MTIESRDDDVIAGEATAARDTAPPGPEPLPGESLAGYVARAFLEALATRRAAGGLPS